MPFVYYWQPLVGSALIGAVLGVLGCFVVLRRMALIGDAISHAVLPGVVVAFLLVSTGITGLFIGALTAGILTAVCINVVSRMSRVKEDAAVGIVFTAMFALGVIMISWLPAGTHFDMKCFLFGDPLAVHRADLISIAVISPIVVGTVLLLFRPLKLVSFDSVMAATVGFNVTALHYLLMILLSATVVAALRSVGVIMAVAMLITPAAVGYQLTNRLQTMIAVAAGTGAASALIGMFLAFQIDCPPGPAMVLVATLMFAATMIFSPQRGVLAERRRRHRVREHIVEEDILKALVRRFENAEAPAAELTQVLESVPAPSVIRAIDRLTREGFVRREQDRCRLTTTGRERAVGLVRAHRLWETYLAEQNIADPELHEWAERLEHAHELAGELSVALGHPTVDPHGEPIPQPDDLAEPGPDDKQTPPARK
jgi:ABC-type Mn2+/Zn2+ transport system permease subunit/Mn-dependent DtxR family transcriptional regulator